MMIGHLLNTGVPHIGVGQEGKLTRFGLFDLTKGSNRYVSIAFNLSANDLCNLCCAELHKEPVMFMIKGQPDNKCNIFDLAFHVFIDQRVIHFRDILTVPSLNRIWICSFSEIIHAAGGFARKTNSRFLPPARFIHGFLLFVGQHPGVQRFCKWLLPSGVSGR